MTDVLVVLKASLNAQDKLFNMISAASPQAASLPPRPRVQLSMEGSTSRTQQSFKEECDVNRIMAKFRKTGEINHLNEHNPSYGDFATGLDFHTAQLAVADAQADFDSLSARIRAKMDNDPAKLLAFVADPENLEEARELGLIAPAPPAPVDPSPQGAAASEAPASPSPAAPIAGGE